MGGPTTKRSGAVHLGLQPGRQQAQVRNAMTTSGAQSMADSAEQVDASLLLLRSRLLNEVGVRHGLGRGWATTGAGGRLQQSAPASAAR